jgi:glycosyltransferase involved in cell wall biosynthesis
MISRLPDGPLPAARRRGFVFVGRFVPNKGVDTLVEAYSEAGLDPDAWPLTLVGDGPLRRAAENRVKSLNIRGVRFTGFVGQQERDEAIRRARWLVAAPCTNEDLGLTPIEARSVGVPAIVSRDGGLPEAAGSEGLICEPRDVQGLSALLRRAAEMPEGEYERRAEATRNELLRWLPATSDYIKVFASVLQR